MQLMVALPALGWTLVGAAACGLPAWILCRRGNGTWAAALFVPYALLFLVPLPPWWAGNIALVAAVCGGALLIGRGLPTRGSLIAFLVVAGVIDVFSFSDGLTRTIIEGYRTGESDLLLRLAFLAPLRDRIVPVVGISDLLITSTAAVALRQLGFTAVPVAVALATGLGAAVLVGVAARGAAALPFIAVAVGVLLVRAGRRRHPRQASPS